MQDHTFYKISCQVSCVWSSVIVFTSSESSLCLLNIYQQYYCQFRLFQRFINDKRRRVVHSSRGEQILRCGIPPPARGLIIYHDHYTMPVILCLLYCVPSYHIRYTVLVIPRLLYRASLIVIPCSVIS